MIDLVLRNLGSPALELGFLLLPVEIHVLDFDVLITSARSDSGQREAAFFCFKRSTFRNNHRIEHDYINKTHIYNNDIFLHTDHLVLRTR